MVRRTQVDNLYRMIRCQFLERIVRARQAQQIACRFSAFRRTSEHALYGNAQSAQGLEVSAPTNPRPMIAAFGCMRVSQLLNLLPAFTSSPHEKLLADRGSFVSRMLLG